MKISDTSFKPSGEGDSAVRDTPSLMPVEDAERILELERAADKKFFENLSRSADEAAETLAYLKSPEAFANGEFKDILPKLPPDYAAAIADMYEYGIPGIKEKLSANLKNGKFMEKLAHSDTGDLKKNGHLTVDSDGAVRFKSCGRGHGCMGTATCS